MPTRTLQDDIARIIKRIDRQIESLERQRDSLRAGLIEIPDWSEAEAMRSMAIQDCKKVP